MPSPVIPAPAVPRAARTRAAASDLPVTRVPEPAGCGTPLRIDHDRRDGTTVLRVDGEIDLLTVDQLGAALDQALAGARRTLVVDVRGVTFVDCAGIGLLVDARWQADRRGVELRVAASRTVARTVALLDLTDLLGLDEQGRAAF